MSVQTACDEIKICLQSSEPGLYEVPTVASSILKRKKLGTTRTLFRVAYLRKWSNHRRKVWLGDVSSVVRGECSRRSTTSAGPPSLGCSALLRAEGTPNGEKSRDIFEENLIQSTQELRWDQRFSFQRAGDTEDSQEQLCGSSSVAQLNLWLEPRDLIAGISNAPYSLH